jgi:UDP-glucuronate 4-epimerase
MPADKRNILITGGAGFIGSHLVDSLLARGDRTVVIDNFNDFYNPATKRANIAAHLKHANYQLVEGDLRDAEAMDKAFSLGPFDIVVHLAAMAGVRPSLANPHLYMDVNVMGTQRLLDRMVKGKIGKTRLVFGSSSSVYGARSGDSFRESDRVDQPLSPYAASKAANEIQCYAAHHTSGLQVVCLRFFTVFGPRQRPDLAIHKFTRLIDNGEPIEVYGDGSSKRDYTFISDIVGGIESAMQYPLSDGYDIINLGRSEPILLKDMIALLENALGKKANLIHKPMQLGDMPYTYADITKAKELLAYKPSTAFATGIEKFVAWYRAQKPAVSV